MSYIDLEPRKLIYCLSAKKSSSPCKTSLLPECKVQYFRTLRFRVVKEKKSKFAVVFTVEESGVDSVSDSTESKEGANTADDALAAALGEDSSEFVECLCHC